MEDKVFKAFSDLEIELLEQLGFTVLLDILNEEPTKE